MKTIAVVQARLGSLRLPGKVLRKIGGQTSIERQIERLSMSSTLDSVVLATTQLEEDDELSSLANSMGWNLFRGASDDVLSRYLDASLEYEADLIVRITGDCPLIDPNIVDEVVKMAERSDAAYFSNVEPPTYPNGLDVEVFPVESLIWASDNTPLPKEREHVTTQLRKSNLIEKENLEWPQDLSAERWTLDTMADLGVITNIFHAFSWRNDFSWLEVLELLQRDPELFRGNRHLRRNEGSSMSPEQKSAYFQSTD